MVQAEQRRVAGPERRIFVDPSVRGEPRHEDDEARVAQEQVGDGESLVEKASGGAGDVTVGQAGDVDDAQSIRVPSDHADVHQRDRVAGRGVLVQESGDLPVGMAIPDGVDEEAAATVARPHAFGQAVRDDDGDEQGRRRGPDTMPLGKAQKGGAGDQGETGKRGDPEAGKHHPVAALDHDADSDREHHDRFAPKSRTAPRERKERGQRQRAEEHDEASRAAERRHERREAAAHVPPSARDKDRKRVACLRVVGVRQPGAEVEPSKEKKRTEECGDDPQPAQGRRSAARSCAIGR